VITEGIETEAQRDRFLQGGCNRGQGFFFSKPLSPETAMAMIQQSIQFIWVVALSIQPL
jgi:EAL domain-containing protein (putative c-di-GMP-specific phosphodiesterase class I)